MPSVHEHPELMATWELWEGRGRGLFLEQRAGQEVTEEAPTQGVASVPALSWVLGVVREGDALRMSGAGMGRCQALVPRAVGGAGRL